jgi:hypothetical protein
MDTLNSSFVKRTLQRKLFQNVTSERESSMSHKTPAADKFRMFFPAHSFKSYFEKENASL